MTNAILNYRRSRAELEESIGVEPIEVLQDRRRDLIRKVAPLRARYGERGTWDARRKLIRYAKQSEIVTTLLRERGKQPSEAEAERMACADPSYLSLIDEIERQMAEYILLENDIDEITERINRDQALIRYAAMEPRA